MMKNFLITVGSMTTITALLVLLFSSVALGNCYGCGDHTKQCIKKEHKHSLPADASDPDDLSAKELAHQKGLIDLTDSKPKKGIVFSVCIFTMKDGKLELVDHKEAKNMTDCLKQKRTKQREYRNPDKREKVIAGGSKKKFIMKCDKVWFELEIKEDGTWHILKILGRNKAAYAKKKPWEK
jgi:hypothetical protein